MTIFDDIENLGTLKVVAIAVVDFITVRSKESKFERTSAGEWALRPDNWIDLKFTSLRKKAVHISLGMSQSDLADDGKRVGLEVKRGRYPNWCKVSIYQSDQLAPLLQLLEVAYRSSHNEHRNWHGIPKKDSDLSHEKHGEKKG